MCVFFLCGVGFLLQVCFLCFVFLSFKSGCVQEGGFIVEVVKSHHYNAALSTPVSEICVKLGSVFTVPMEVFHFWEVLDFDVYRRPFFTDSVVLRVNNWHDGASGNCATIRMRLFREGEWTSWGYWVSEKEKIGPPALSCGTDHWEYWVGSD